MIHDRDKPTTFSYFLLRKVFFWMHSNELIQASHKKNWKTFNEKNISYKEVKQNSSFFFRGKEDDDNYQQRKKIKHVKKSFFSKKNIIGLK